MLYRTDAQSAALCEAFDRSGMPFKRHTHAPLAQHPGVRALMQALECEAAAQDATSLLRSCLIRAADRLIGDGQAEIRSGLQLLMPVAEACVGDMAGLADAVALANDADGWDPRADRVSLLTLHAAKGLEFPVVFIVGLEDGILPLRWGNRSNAADEQAEERRLFYVGMTRARDRLFLSRAERRPWRGGSRMLSASPFLTDIEAQLVEHSRATAKHKAADQLKLL